jgi:predicted nucleic acid-binding protein
MKFLSGFPYFRSFVSLVEATILVTGDKELLREATSLNCHVMTLKDFEAI